MTDTITLIYYNSKTGKFGINPHIDRRILTTTGALFYLNENERYTVCYYNDKENVAFALLKED